MIGTQENPTRNHQEVRSTSRIRIIGTGAIVLLALVATGAVPRFLKVREAIAASNDAPVTHPVVSVIHATKGEPSSQLSLPGNVEPLYTADLFARIDGYVDRRNVDIGTNVRAGEILAVISAPEIDQQLSQAKATLAQSQAALLETRAALDQAKANAELARLTKERDVPLGEQHAISQQIVDGAVQTYNARLADVEAANAKIASTQATVAANQANVARLEQMQAYERIVAPFDGVITERNVERGDLVSASAPAASRPLFRIAQNATLRIYVDVPQSEAINIQDGQKATILISERLGRTYTGTVARNASALNNEARTLRTEVQIDNRDGSLLPGMYAQVQFTLPQEHTSLIIPTSSLVIDRAGMHVVAVEANHKLHFIPVTIGKDMGKEVEVLAGLGGAEALVASPSDLLVEGEHVEVQ